jgi:hypothetical protein
MLALYLLALYLPSRYQSISDIGVGETVESLGSKAVAPELQLEQLSFPGGLVLQECSRPATVVGMPTDRMCRPPRLNSCNDCAIGPRAKKTQ